jgi:hypothetical protein
MRHRGTILTIISAAAMLAAAPPAGAVVKGTRSHSLTSYTVRLVGDGYCTAAVIGRRLVVTARHCAYRMTVLAAHRYYRVARVSRDGVLDDGRRVHASGDASFLYLTKPLPETIAAVPVGDGDGDNFIIAGYGGSGRLHQANLVAASPYALVDPGRDGAISASACFGDSGGPVLRGGVLVGVITRAAYPHKRIACGNLTRWAPISVSGNVEVLGPGVEKTPLPKARPTQSASRHPAHPTPVKQAAAGGFGNWFVRMKAKR